MGDSHIKRSMDEFLVNPTVPMDDYRRIGEPSSPAGNAAHPDRSNTYYTLKLGDKPAEDPTTIRRFDNVAGWRGYTSDEEVASPVENDDFTFDSTSSDGDSIASIHEAQYHAQIRNNAQQLCNRAQAVQLVSVGKPKVVSMPKPVDFPATYSPQAFDHETEVRPSVSSMSYMRPAGGYYHIHSSTGSSPRSSGENSYPSFPIPPTSQPTGPRLVRRKPVLPRLQTSNRSDSPQSDTSSSTPRTAWPVGRPNFLDYDPFSSDYSVHVAASSSTPKRRLHRLSPPFSLKSLSRSLRRSSTSDGSSGDGGINKRDISGPIGSPIISDVHVPTRTSSKPMPKMVARGANDRAAPIEIPPCPDDYQDGFNVPAWPQRSDSVAQFDGPRSVAPRIHGRRKSLSVFVSTQA
jgi:hypothetical protein